MHLRFKEINLKHIDIVSIPCLKFKTTYNNPKLCISNLRLSVLYFMWYA